MTAALHVLKRVGISKAQGKSLFIDGVGVVVFTLMLSLAALDLVAVQIGSRFFLKRRGYLTKLATRFG